MYYPILMPHYSYQIVARGGLQMRPIWGWARVGDRRARPGEKGVTPCIRTRTCSMFYIGFCGCKPSLFGIG